MRVFIYLFCLILFQSFVYVGDVSAEGNQAPEKPSRSVSGGGQSIGSVRSGPRGSAPGNVMGISYSASTEHGTKQRLEKRISLGRPKTQVGEGIYVWRDGKNTWTVHYLGERPSFWIGEISSDAPIGNIKVSDTAIAAGLRGEKFLAIFTVDETLDATVNFSTDGSYVKMKFLINGKPKKERIYIGAGAINPDAHSFKLRGGSLEIEPAPEKNKSIPIIKSEIFEGPIERNNKGASSGGGGGGGKIRGSSREE